MGSELFLAIVLIGGFSFLYGQRRYRAVRRKALAARGGLAYRSRGLESLPAELQQSVLFRIAGGGHERDVITARPVLAEESVPFTAFDFELHRDVRGEWAYLDVDRPFRLHGPTSVLAYELPVRCAHVVIKRAGPADTIEDQPLERYRSIAHTVRDASALEHASPIEAGELAPESEGFGPADRWRVWIADPEQARSILPPRLRGYLISPASGDRELVIELIGRLALLYPASGGPLEQSELLSMQTFADELVTQVVRALAPAAGRGYVPAT
jgi:hypothetical protein